MSIYLQEHQMPGPTDEARALQYKQYVACDAMYEVWNKADPLERGECPPGPARPGDSATGCTA